MKPLTYSDAGVHLDAWRTAKGHIGHLVQSTYNDKVLGGFGQFGGLFDAAALKAMNRPVLVSSVDGVGTKLKVAFATGIHDTIGEDIVNHCVDDILVMGATPLFFLDYLAVGALSPQDTEQIVTGLARACRENGVVLIGGETAEMPGFYAAGEYDIAGTIIGVVDADNIVDGTRITPGDRLVGLRSNGLHTNGYSLASKLVIDVAGKRYDDIFEATGQSFGRELLRPHRSYLPILPCLQDGTVKGCAHITGGGYQENVDRILPQGCDAVVDTRAWVPDRIFAFLQAAGGIANDEMYRTFNMGMGMVLVVDATIVDQLCERDELKPFEPVVIGRVESGNGSVRMEY